MSDRIAISCDGTFDDGRMPCRASISFRAALYATVANDDLTDRYAARIAAFEQGWSEDGGYDYCPAHTRSRRAEAQFAQIVRVTTPSGTQVTLSRELLQDLGL
jgi:hypothetical protein